MRWADMNEMAPVSEQPQAIGGMAERIRAHDWSATPLGSMEDWPDSLSTLVALMLAAPQIATLAVGPQRIFLYNDAAASHYAGRHPQVLGQPLAEAFAHEFSRVAPFYDRTFAGESLHVPAQSLDPGETGAADLFDAWLTPVRDPQGDVIAVYMTGLAVGDQRRAEDKLREAEERLRILMTGIPQLVWRAYDGGRWTWASPQWTDYTGQAEADSHGLGWLEMVHPDDRDGVKDIWAGAIERGEFHADYRLHNAGEGRYRWFQTRATPVRDAGGAIIEWLGTSTDIDDLRRLQERQLLLVAELQHRVRNILTVVRSVFGRTVNAGGELEDLADHFQGRLDSLARTQVVVTQNASGLVDLENLIRDELLSVGAGDGPSLVIEGPDVALPPEAAESIGLAIHELITNALKYGALKVRGATLEIRWTVNMDCGGVRRLDLTWTERGVPAIALKPAREGFGSELIKEALPYRLGAETSLIFRGGGVCCSISMPLPDEGALAAFARKA